MAVNVVELLSDGEDDAFDQPCKFGHRVDGHAVYCHNDAWRDGPRKCRRTWYTGGETKDEDCPGFEPNPLFNGELQPSPISSPVCKTCKGSRHVRPERGQHAIETCPLCRGSGSAPRAMKLSQFQQDTLEIGCEHTGKNKGHSDYYVRVTESSEQYGEVCALADLNLVGIRSISFGRGSQFAAFLLERSAKGEAVMEANWRAKKRTLARKGKGNESAD